MADKVGSLPDRIANRIVRHLPHQSLLVRPLTPIVSFSFDDAPESAWRNGADILEGVGGRGTYYLAGGLSGLTAEGLKIIGDEGCADLAARGHELACHTFAHRKLATYSRNDLIADLERNQTWLGRYEHRNSARNFAVPFTMASPLLQAVLRSRFLTSRGGHQGINRGKVDPHYLSAFELRPEVSPQAIGAVLDDLSRDPGWLIVFTHDISDDPSPYGFPRTAFTEMVRSVAARGFHIASVDAAIDLMGVRERLAKAVSSA